jgi:hypothetical protein
LPCVRLWHTTYNAWQRPGPPNPVELSSYAHPCTRPWPHTTPSAPMPPGQILSPGDLLSLVSSLCSRISSLSPSFPSPTHMLQPSSPASNDPPLSRQPLSPASSGGRWLRAWAPAVAEPGAGGHRFGVALTGSSGCAFGVRGREGTLSHG